MRIIKHLSILIIIFVFFPFLLFSQAHLAVNLNHPVYTFLEIAEIKGALSNLSLAKPYSHSMVLSYLKTANGNKAALNQTEQVMLLQMIKEFEKSRQGIRKGNFPFQGFMGDTMLGIKGMGNSRLNFNDIESWHMYNALCFYLKGDISSFLSYYGSFGFTFDKIDPDSFVPYSFTKEWDSFHIGFGEERYSVEGIESTPYFSFRLEDEICSEFFNNHLLIRWARLRRDWGFSEGNLYLSKSARPYEGIDLYAHLSSRIALSYTFGSLSNWQKEALLRSDPDALSYQKMFSLQMIEFFPCKWLTLSMASSAIWGKRFEIGYLNPLMYPVIHQNLHGDFDNVVQSVNIIFHIPKYAKLYFSFFADEMELTNQDNFFTNPRNMYAFQAGAKIPVPILPFSLITLQYTKIEPFVYTHYPEEYYASASTSVDLSYTHDGEHLGSYLDPNSDEILVKIESQVLTQLKLSLQYQLIRHGTNDSNIAGDYAIFGHVDEYFYYDFIDQYPDKKFLKDGLYDWNNIISLEVIWQIPQYSTELTFGYSFSYTYWVENESGITPPDDEIKNIFSLSYKIFH